MEPNYVPADKLPQDLQFVPEDKLPADLVKKAAPEAKEEAEPGFVRKAYNFMGGATGLGGTGGALLGTAFAPETGGLSLLIPVVAAALGGGTGAALEGKSPLKEGLKEGAMQGVFGGLGKVARPAWQFAKDSVVKTFGSRELVSEAAESLLKKWMNPAVKGADLYAAAEATRKLIPTSSTARTVDNLLREEVGRMPLPVKTELLEVLGPIQNFSTVARGRGFQLVRTQPVADAMADVRRLSNAARQAFSGQNPNTDLGNAINKVRAALLDDLERAGVPEVKMASRAYRKEMAIEDLARQIAKPNPGIKIRDYARDNPLFKGAFSKAEQDQIDRITKKLAFVAPSGASGVLGKMATTTMGGVAGGTLGGIAGYVAPEYLRTLLASPAGRSFMEHTLADSYKLGPSKLANYIAPMWSTFARGLMAGGDSSEYE
jgi:hypothetical protein